LLAAQQASERNNEKRKALELALEKARYQSERARRQYDCMEPENRLVAAELDSPLAIIRPNPRRGYQQFKYV
jgi:hypothetical protein